MVPDIPALVVVVVAVAAAAVAVELLLVGSREPMGLVPAPRHLLRLVARQHSLPVIQQQH